MRDQQLDQLPPEQHRACVGAIFRASGLTNQVDPNIEFPRPAGPLAERLDRTRVDGAYVPCAHCASSCATRSYVDRSTLR